MAQSPEQSIEDYLDKIDKLSEETKEDAEKILQAIDMKELLKDPEGYLMALADVFLVRHVEAIEEAKKAGMSQANRMMGMA